MSRLGKIPVAIPKDVKLKISGRLLTAEGPKGKLELELPVGISVEQQENNLIFNRLHNDKQSLANHGTARSLVQNTLIGVAQGHVKELEIQGVGLRGQVSGEKLVLSLGFSHPVEFEVPKDVKVSVNKQTEIKVEGIDKSRVGLVAAKIRALKEPEPYKGKGIRYVGENVRRKQGKSVTK